MAFTLFSKQFERFLVLYRFRLGVSILFFAFLCGINSTPLLLAIVVGILVCLPAMRISILWIFPGLLAAILVLHSHNHEEGVQSVQVEVIRAPRYPRPGAISLDFRLIDNGLFKRQLRCRGRHLPWLNSARVHRGDTVAALIEIRGEGNFCTIHALSLPVSRNPRLLSKYREQLTSRVRGVLGDGNAAGAVLAMTLGVRDGLSTKMDEVLRVMGLSHVFVVSGFHFGILYFALSFLFRVVVRLAPQVFVNFTNLRDLLVTAILLLYLVLLGEGQSALRAFLMILSLRLAAGLGLRITFLDAVVLTAFIMFIASPEQSLDLSSLLSLFALLAIALLLLDRSQNKFRFAFLLWLSVSIPGVIWFERLCWPGIFSSVIFGSALAFVGTGVGGVAILFFEIGIDSEAFLLKSVAFFVERILWVLDFCVNNAPVPLCVEQKGQSRWVIAMLLGLGVGFWALRTITHSARLQGIRLMRREPAM
jgi:ComEC/Rec2-related protein